MAASTGAPAPRWKPQGHPSTVSTWLMCKDAHKVIDFMTDVFNAQGMCKMMNDDDATVRHASLNIDGSVVMVSEACDQYPASPVVLYVYVEDADKVYHLALSKGAESVQAPRDEFYGDRASCVKDLAGNTWWIATYKFKFEPNAEPTDRCEGC